MKTVFTMLLTALAFETFSQTRIAGRVHDIHGQPIPLANIILQNTYDGTTSDMEGRFEFTTDETGPAMLVVKFIGYKDQTRQFNLDGKAIVVDITLHETINELEAVTITAGSFMASDESRRTIFRAVDIATTAGATADIAGALNTLPGTQKVGETGRLFVRGGGDNETRTFIDGMVVMDPYSPSAPNTPSRGRFLPFMFKGTSFSTGGYSAEYGQALSAALVLDSKDASEITRTDIGILSVGGDIAHTQAWDKGSAAAKVQYTNIRPYFGLINQEVDWKTPPASIDGIGAVRQRVGEHGMVKVFGNFTHSNFSLFNHDIDEPGEKFLYGLTNDYRYINGSYKDALNQNWTVRGGLSYTLQKNKTDVAEDHISERSTGIHAKTVFEGALSEKIELKAGAEILRRDHRLQHRPETGATNLLSFQESIVAGFAEADLYTSNNFVVRGGFRIEYNDMIRKFGVDPRLSLAYKIGDPGQVSFAYGRFRQSANNEWVRVNPELDQEKAEHFILNYQRIADNRTFRVETYYKRYDDLTKFSANDPTLLSNNGNGYAKGIELFWRDNESLKNVDYWISYSYLDTKRDYLGFPYEAIPAFASRHNFSAVYKHFVQPIQSQLGLTYSFASGRPYYDPNKHIFNSGKTPVYSDLSFTWSYLPKPWLIVFFSCSNLLGRDNIFGYEFSDEKNVSGQYAGRAVRQPAKRFVFLALLITLSKDKSMNQLPAL